MMEKKFDVIVLGRVTVDFNPLDYYNTLENNQRFAKYIGGSAGNTAIGLARYQHQVGFIGKTSNDQFGKFIVQTLEKEKVDISHLYQDPKAKVGLTFTEMESQSASRILMYRDEVADLNLNASEIDSDYLKNSKLILLSGTTFSASPAREALFKAMLIAKENNQEIVFDIDYRPYRWKDLEECAIIYHLVAKHADIIVGSLEEFRLASKFLVPQSETADSQTLAQAWLKSAKIVIIKNGKKGSQLFSHKKNYDVKIYPIKMLKSFGGGDAYLALFLHNYLLDPENLKKALTDATCAASYMVQSHSSFDHPRAPILAAFVKKALAEIPDLVKERN